MDTQGVTRIRYPQIMDVRLRLTEDIYLPSYNDNDWLNPIQVTVSPVRVMRMHIYDNPVIVLCRLIMIIWSWLTSNRITKPIQQS